MQRDKQELGKSVVESMRRQETIDHMARIREDVEINVARGNPFEDDLYQDMINVGRGHDPHNHIGQAVVCDVLGIDVPIYPDRFSEYTKPVIGIGEPIFAGRLESLGHTPILDEITRSRSKPKSDTFKLDNQSPVRIGESVVNMEGGE